MNNVPFHLLLISDGWDESTAARVTAALAALAPGTAAVQLRAHAATANTLFAAAKQLVSIAHAHGAKLLVNDRIDVALAAGADGVHLPLRSFSPAQARALGGADFVVGASTHSLDEARAAAESGADYVTFGPVYFTPSKAHYGSPLGLEALSEAVGALAIPVFALGGVDAERARECVARGARVACIGAVLGQPDAARGARNLEDALKRS